MGIDVSIIIVNYYTSGQISDCIESIRKHTSGVSYEIIIVDNDTEPDLEDRYKSDRDVMVIRLPENVGFGRANNAGFAVAEGRYLFCLNPDTVLLNNAIGILADFMDEHPDAAACGGNLYGSDLKPTHSYRMFLPGMAWECNDFLNRRPEKLRYGLNAIFNDTGKPHEVAYITGADLMLRRSAVEKTGGYDPDFFMYFEDTDLCRRVGKECGKIYSVPEARIMHLEGGSFDKSRGISISRVERTAAGRRLYYKKNVNPAARLVSNMFYLMTLVTRSILLPACPKREGWRRQLRLFLHPEDN